MGLIQRERRDIFYKIAKALGYRSRSALKLLQIHEATGILQGEICFLPLFIYEFQESHEPLICVLLLVDLARY